MQGALRWPTFLLALPVLFWAAPLAALLGYPKWWRLRGRRNDTYEICRCMVDFFRIRVVLVGQGALHRGRCMYLANHRSWADFFLDLYFLEGRACTLSRLLVLFTFPTTLISSYALRAVIFFKRGKIRDKEKFNRWLDGRLAKSPYKSFLVYPEGHRSTRGQSLPLKRGMLHYAFDRRLPVQVVISANKDAVLAEKAHTARFCQTVGVTYSELIQPERFGSFEDFMRRVQHTWDTQWAEADSADFAGLPPLPPAVIDMNYPLTIRLRQAAALLFWAAVLVLVVAPATLRFLRSAYLALGAAGPLVVALLAAYTAASLKACSQPCDVRGAANGDVRGRAAGPAAAPALAAAPPDATAGKTAGAAPSEAATGAAEE